MKHNSLALNYLASPVRHVEAGHVVANKQHTQQQLNPRLLAPYDRMAHQSLSVWSSHLLAELERFHYQKMNDNDYVRLAEIFNNAAFILFASGDIKSARELCYSHIQTFITLDKRHRHESLLKHSLMPWINLIRLDRYEGKLSEAMYKLNLLTGVQDDTHEFILNHIHSASLMLGNHLDMETGLQIKQTCEFELIKIYLQMRQHAMLGGMIEAGLDIDANWSKIHLHEAMIVCLANQGKYHDAHEWIQYGKSQLSLIGINILLLRECELLLHDHQNIQNQLEYLATFVLCELSANVININDIMFALRIGSLMMMSGVKCDLVELLYYCMEAADKLNDEVLKAEAMLLLFQCLRQGEGKRIIENLMIDHYVKTEYQSVRRNMLAIFPALAHVNHAQSSVVSSSLFNELQLFSAKINY